MCVVRATGLLSPPFLGTFGELFIAKGSLLKSNEENTLPRSENENGVHAVRPTVRGCAAGTRFLPARTNLDALSREAAVIPASFIAVYGTESKCCVSRPM